MEAEAAIVLARWFYYGAVMILFGSSLFPLYALAGRDPTPALLPRAVNVTLAVAAVDDTGARHKAANGTCTQIGNDHFAWFGTTASKSRLNFLELLRAGHPDYVINAEALAYMRERGLSASLIEQLAGQPDRHFPDRAA